MVCAILGRGERMETYSQAGHQSYTLTCTTHHIWRYTYMYMYDRSDGKKRDRKKRRETNTFGYNCTTR